MDISSAVATWLSCAATLVGLGSLATQFSAIIDHTDPFHTLRDIQHLGSWSCRQPDVPWYHIVKPPPVGPVIRASLFHGFCGQNTVFLSRLPFSQQVGQAAWSLLLGVIHPTSQTNRQRYNALKSSSKEEVLGFACTTVVMNEPSNIIPSESWANMPLCPLARHKLTTCTVISRTTLMAILCLTNSRPVFCHSGASGHRAAYACYCGQWRVEWPIGDVARVYFRAHDSHALSDDPYPPIFQQRVDKCLQILAGVIESQKSNSFKCAFPGRKSSGQWILEYAVKGFGGAHGGRHLYNMIGGNVNEVDFLFMKAMHTKIESSEDMMVLHLPNKDTGTFDVTLYIPRRESAILNEALDNLPWTFLSWSIHRGLHDILVAYARERMDRYRSRLADTLRLTVAKWPERLDARGWNPQFVRENMADMAVSAVMAGRGNSGDAVRVVTEIAAALWNGPTSALDETNFWRDTSPSSCPPILDPITVAALVKCFVLEWSIHLDYQMYHDFPLEMYLG
ncbi:hypothetical protein N7457_007436 [Penicillium paradoxum]|uniref:uncharacterized protein n=1 Tax=Penicillium paradoxum TaxID=176176 RepID=UPI002548B3C5|nr:uncharacterized protein N7457_007436 [Penicillium paradoxum]KAJ5779716.1 hypothetical protein N7457_007436 [Penicillium paradoxum]